MANAGLEPHEQITLYKNNSDGKGNSYGCHENYLVERGVEFAHVVRAMVPHFVSRQIVVGAGKVGAETEDALAYAPAFQVSQRAEFFEEVVGLETTLKRPIINTRDEPHGDPERFRRLHVIIGDANLSQVATLVKLGSTALLLAVLEDRGAGVFPSPPRHPVHAVRAFSLDTSLTATVICEDGDSAAVGLPGPAVDAGARLRRPARRRLPWPRPNRSRSSLSHWREMLDGVRDDPTRWRTASSGSPSAAVVEGYRDAPRPRADRRPAARD